MRPRDAVPRARLPSWQRIADVVLSTEPKRRFRTTQWTIGLFVYMASTMVLWLGVGQGWMYGPGVVGWTAFLGVGLTLLYIAIRSGWSERFSDPALTVAQMMLGIVAVVWGYLISGPVRSVALFPLMLIFTFGAFSLSWRRIAVLTALALASLFVSVTALHSTRDGLENWSLENVDLRLDVSNVLIMTIVLPVLSLVAARLSALRLRLRSQRAELTEALRKLENVAIRDDLTGLVNRRHMLERLDHEQSRFMRFGHAFSIAVIDLDHFKDVNDAYGHAGGDEVLRTFADEATATLRTSDVLARWGGEEFLLLMPETRAPPAQAAVERLLARVRALPVKIGVPLSFSAGVTEHRAGETLVETIARADREMYAAKKAGRNRVLLQ